MSRLARLWGIRHLRAFYLDALVWRWAGEMQRAGIGMGIPHPNDLEHIERVWRGEA